MSRTPTAGTTLTRKLISRPLRWLFFASVTVLVVSGLAQMPIFKRYYVADLPGLGWLADYYFTHALHYVAAAVFLAIVFYLTARFVLEWRRHLGISTAGLLRIGLYGLIIITGVARLLKNFPNLHFSPTATMLIDWSHLGFVILLGIAALIALASGYSNYLRIRKN